MIKQLSCLKQLPKVDLFKKYDVVDIFYNSNVSSIYKVVDKTDKSKRVVAVKVKFIKKLKKPVSLEKIKKNKELSHLSLIKQSRLSVMPIDSKSWKILNNMGKI